ncbi:MAG: leucyl aminopeptidase [Chloroflexi bacterium]|nr:MAG: leucyl aminopeptidase [Chloroflexota bacterium]
MKFRAVRPSQLGKVDAIVVPLFAGTEPPAWLPRTTRNAIARLLKEEQGVTRLYGVNTLHEEPRVVIVGAGKPGQLDAERARNIASAGVRALWRSSVRKVGIAIAPDAIGEERAAQAAVEGAIYAMWRPEAHRTREEERHLPNIDQVLLVTEKSAPAAIDRGSAVGEATNVARRLANEPANRMTPTLVAEAAQELAKEAGVRIEVLDADRCRALGMGSFLSVAQGSHEPPRFIVMRHRGRGGSGYDLGLVGKGITFDSGGISIKPADNMHHMKADMTGAASVIAALAAIGKLGLKANVIGVAPCTENLPGGGATKPGDVFTAMSGKTVEVINTDAEGRLVLVDGITYAQREGAKRVVDVATLTGSIAVGLGQHFSGLFGKPDAFVEIVRQTATAAGDRMWPMPLTDEYRDDVKGEVADVRNSTGARTGGAITAAAFLESSVEDGTEWAHMDIAGTFWFERDRPHAPKGPQGPAVRTLIALAERFAQQSQ